MDTSLWPIVLTGLFTLGGSLGGIGVGLVGSARRDVAQQRHEKSKRRADKFEELVAAVYEFDVWLESLRDREAFGRDGIPVTASPIAKVKSISAVYFPQFSKLILEVEVAEDRYRGWIYAAKKERIATPFARLTAGFDDAFWPYTEKRDALLKALKEFARNEFQ
jgi:hypothetical protein